MAKQEKAFEINEALGKYAQRIVYKQVIPTKTQIRRNKTIVGDSIEIMIEKIRNGAGEDAIEERDLVYYDNESTVVNPIANIRTDIEEMRLDEQIGRYEHQHKAKPGNETEGSEGATKEGGNEE